MPTSKVAAQAPLVAIAILNYNGADYLERFLPSVLQTTYANTQLFVIDNGSTDDSIDRLKKWGFERFMATADQPLPPHNLQIEKFHAIILTCPKIMVLQKAIIEAWPNCNMQIIMCCSILM